MDGEIYINVLGENSYKLCYDFRGTTRFMVLTKEQINQLKEQLELLNVS